MIKRVPWVFGMVVLMAALAFNNCGKFQAADAIDMASSKSSQCRAKITAEANLEKLRQDPTLCESGRNYQCDRRVFRPGIGSAQTVKTECLHITGFGEACLPVNLYNYDTTAQQLASPQEDNQEGGAYNREEVTCVNTQVLSQDIPVIRAEGTSLADTLARTIDLCRQRSAE